MKKRIAIFASGSGTNTDAIIRYFKGNSIVQIKLIITNRPNVGVIQIAEQNNIEHKLILNKDWNNESLVLSELNEIDWIILAGFLIKIPEYLVVRFKNKMINIHPALLPKYGGKGMYGKHVHEAVLGNNEKKSGITIHFVTEEYDEGNIIFQKEVGINENETLQSLEEKIHRLEHEYYPKVIEDLMNKI